MYAKVFASLWDGTLGRHHAAWSVFVYMLANCNAKGDFEQTPEAIAARTGMTPADVEKGLRTLEQTDRNSRTPTEDGRRIVRLDEHRDWGWRIVNYALYRESRDRDERRIRNAEYQRKHRQLVAAQVASAKVSTSKPRSAQAEAEAEAEEDKKKRQKRVSKTPTREITEAQKTEASRRFKLPLETVSLLAEKIQLEFDSRGYRNAYSALLSWCSRESKGREQGGDPYGAAMWDKGGT